MGSCSEKLKEQARLANGNKAKHRYTRLLRCKEYGNPFVPMIRYWNKKRRAEYVCKGYHRNGKAFCLSHRTHEKVLDAAVWEYLSTVWEDRAKERDQLVQLQKLQALRKTVLDARIFVLKWKIQKLEQEIDNISMEYLNGNRHAFY